MTLPHSPNFEIFIAQNNTFFIATVSVAKDAAYWIVHAPFTSIVVFWHIGNVPPMIS